MKLRKSLVFAVAALVVLGACTVARAASPPTQPKPTICAVAGSCVSGGSSKWSDLTDPTAPLSLTMPAASTTTFTTQSTTQSGFTIQSSALTSGNLLRLAITGATASGDNSGLRISSTATGMADTQNLIYISSSGANTNIGVDVIGLRSVIQNSNGNNTAIFAAANGGDINRAIFVQSGNVALASGTYVGSSASDGFVSYSVNGESLAQGSAGSLIIPYADMANAADDAARDALAGNVNGAMAVDSVGVLGVYKTWFRVNGAWLSVALS